MIQSLIPYQIGLIQNIFQRQLNKFIFRGFNKSIDQPIIFIQTTKIEYALIPPILDSQTLRCSMVKGQWSISALKHISRFIHQYREVVDFEFLKLRLFLNSLMGSAFTWYIYHQTLFRIGMTYKLYSKHTFLGKLKQYTVEIVKQYLNRFMKAGEKCWSRIRKREFVTIA